MTYIADNIQYVYHEFLKITQPRTSNIHETSTNELCHLQSTRMVVRFYVFWVLFLCKYAFSQIIARFAVYIFDLYCSLCHGTIIVWTKNILFMKYLIAWNPYCLKYLIAWNPYCLKYLIAWNTLSPEIPDCLQYPIACNTLLPEIPYCL